MQHLKVRYDKGMEDYVYNYGCLHLSIGLLLRSADVSVKEGDGERLLRAWNFLTVCYWAENHSKYAKLFFISRHLSLACLLQERCID